MENLMISLNAVLPMFLVVGLGCAARRLGILSRQAALEGNSLCFKLLIPLLLFDNVCKSNLGAALDGGLLAFSLAGIAVEFFLAVWIVPRLESNRSAQGVMVQSCFRANTVLMGLPVCTALYGEEGAACATLLLAVVVPVLNVLSVLTFELFRGGAPDLGRILRGSVTNPLVLGSLAGILFTAAGLRLPEVLESAVSGLAAAATPMALLMMGAAMEFSRLRGAARDLILCTVQRLALAPGAALPLAAALGFRGVSLCALIPVFAVPVAVNSYTMAQQMDGDADLAGGIVLLSSACSCVTLFLWIWLLKSLGWI